MGFHVFNSTVPLPLSGDSKPRRGYYTRSLLCDAVKQVMRGTMTVTQAAHYYKIPRTTVQKHFSKAREQHNLKELYISRMQALERDLLGQVPESVFQQELSNHGTAFLLSYGVNIWPSDSHEASPTFVHWRQQPVRITSSPKYDVGVRSSFSHERNMAVAERCEVRCGEVEPVVSLHEERERRAKSSTS